MSPSDPRHGTRAGYIAGCRSFCCGDPHYRYQKRSRLRLLTEGSQIVDAAPVRDRVDWWAQRGLGINALGRAAGLGFGTIAEIVSGERDVCLRSTVRAVESVTWASLPDAAHIYADLTRRRIFSLMAAGHRIDDMAARTPGLSRSGRWRYQERVTVAMARAVVATADTLAATVGSSAITRVKARNAGHLPPLAWDDPGWLAAPKGWQPVVDVAPVRTVGRPEVATGIVEDFDWLVSQGESERQAADRLGVHRGTIRDYRRRLAKREAAS